ncbi:HAMP domain-containing sensor histidine kinase [Tengunoibacter tsumagoiensis]|uniref:histidine kinase n=1 Tax=Tengunoibacter tsumagoiensis TaxID=2014871 RepID=A0A402A1G3_9CHLR|nr:sensor histidine kinase [Tengunoibacter tsumagoiensis]GCE12987.1 histidine kinase [Tengunoibacter tsumagoiensis]
MRKSLHSLLTWVRTWQLSLFEKVILINTLMLVGEALAGLWVTSHNLETQHYLIDTGFLVAATLFTLVINSLVIRTSFRPLFRLLFVIREISAGRTQIRAPLSPNDGELHELAHAFNAMLDRLENLRHEQAQIIFQTQEDERRRIALELHDEAGQTLTALLIHEELLQQQLRSLSEDSLSTIVQIELIDEVQQLMSLTQLTLENIRVLSQQLRPSVLDDLGLAAALRWLADDSQKHLQLEIVLTIEEEAIKGLSKLYETTIFRIAQESLTNVARHAHTSHAWISLRVEEPSLRLTIEDKGCGFQTDQHYKSTGLFGMRERATQIGGVCEIRSRPGQGTQVSVRLPLPENAGEILPPKIR